MPLEKVKSHSNSIGSWNFLTYCHIPSTIISNDFHLPGCKYTRKPKSCLDIWTPHKHPFWAPPIQSNFLVKALSICVFFLKHPMGNGTLAQWISQNWSCKYRPLQLSKIPTVSFASSFKLFSLPSSRLSVRVTWGRTTYALKTKEMARKNAWLEESFRGILRQQGWGLLKSTKAWLSPPLTPGKVWTSSLYCSSYIILMWNQARGLLHCRACLLLNAFCLLYSPC